MDSDVITTILWVAAAAVLVLYLGRRNRRKRTNRS
jgi:MYXO-CTERM domain-containing protein